MVHGGLYVGLLDLISTPLARFPIILACWLGLRRGRDALRGMAGARQRGGRGMRHWNERCCRRCGRRADVEAAGVLVKCTYNMNGHGLR